MMNRKPKGLRDRVAEAIRGESTPSVDPELVREMAALLEETGLTEIEVERGGVRLRVARHPGPQIAPAFATPVAAPAQPPAPAAAAEAEVEPTRKRGTLVTSPMVGTVYLAPRPGAAPFVKVGDTVTDETVCIIEAMKTMNPVTAPASGRIAEIYVYDGQPVEFGEPLMLID